jgi:hypothetical protein
LTWLALKGLFKSLENIFNFSTSYHLQYLINGKITEHYRCEYNLAKPSQISYAGSNQLSQAKPSKLSQAKPV